MTHGNGIAARANGKANGQTHGRSNGQQSSHPPADVLASRNPATGEIDFTIAPISDMSCRGAEVTNDYSLVFLQSGHVQLHHSCAGCELEGPYLVFSTPFQPFLLTSTRNITGYIIRFTPDFHKVESSGCTTDCGSVFHRAQGLSHAQLSADDVQEIAAIVEAVKRELSKPVPMRDLIFAYLNVLLVIGTRVSDKHDREQEEETHPDHQVLRKLKRFIEVHFRTTKRPSDYAAMLFLSTRALNKLVKQHLRKTLTDVIQERVMEEARRELAFSDHSVKEVAASVGFDDPYYFSRIFKKLSRVSPEHYRSAIRHLAPVLPVHSRHGTGVELKKQGSTSSPVLY